MRNKIFTFLIIVLTSIYSLGPAFAREPTKEKPPIEVPATFYKYGEELDCGTVMEVPFALYSIHLSFAPIIVKGNPVILVMPYLFLFGSSKNKKDPDGIRITIEDQNVEIRRHKSKDKYILLMSYQEYLDFLSTLDDGKKMNLEVDYLIEPDNKIIKVKNSGSIFHLPLKSRTTKCVKKMLSSQ